MLRKLSGVTLLEILVVIIIIGVLATLGLPRFTTMRERALDNEAKANLKLIQAAERIYEMERGTFWPDDGSTVGVAGANGLNAKLRLDLPAAGNWNYTATAGAGGLGPLDARAVRNNPPTGWARTFYINETEETACCCPKTSVCFSQDWCTACPPPPY